MDDLSHSWISRAVENDGKSQERKIPAVSEHGTYVGVLRWRIQGVERIIKVAGTRRILSKPWLNLPPEGAPKLGGLSFALTAISDFFQRKRW